MRGVQHSPSLCQKHDLVNGQVTPSIEATPDRSAKRRRTTSSLEVPIPATPGVDTSPQTVTEARLHISKELSTNGLLSGHQRSVLETAISFVDQLTHTPTPTMTDRSTFDKSMHVSTDMSQRELFNIIIGSQFPHHIIVTCETNYHLRRFQGAA